jgi:hypothetical protein
MPAAQVEADHDRLRCADLFHDLNIQVTEGTPGPHALGRSIRQGQVSPR